MKMMNKTQKSLLIASAIVLAAMIGAILVGPRPYPFPEERRLADRFIELIQNNHLQEAYALTNQSAVTGTSLALFEKNVYRQLGVDQFPDRRSVQFSRTWSEGHLTYAYCFRRWIRGRRLQADHIGFNYYIQGMPFAVDVHRGKDDRWRIANFQSHAE